MERSNPALSGFNSTLDITPVANPMTLTGTAVKTGILGSLLTASFLASWLMIQASGIRQVNWEVLLQ